MWPSRFWLTRRTQKRRQRVAARKAITAAPGSETDRAQAEIAHLFEPGERFFVGPGVGVNDPDGTRTHWFFWPYGSRIFIKTGSAAALAAFDAGEIEIRPSPAPREPIDVEGLTWDPFESEWS